MHTKTPWSLNYAKDGICSEGRGITLMTDLFGEPANSPEDKANAVHIVKCVNSHDALVAALEGLLSDIVEYQTINKLGGVNNHWQVNARAALALARGK